jgi:hypothetical protein
MLLKCNSDVYFVEAAIYSFSQDALETSADTSTGMNVNPHIPKHLPSLLQIDNQVSSSTLEYAPLQSRRFLQYSSKLCHRHNNSNISKSAIKENRLLFHGTYPHKNAARSLISLTKRNAHSLSRMLAMFHASPPNS